MTATPIPRTLHMSLMGLKDISSLQTPPQDRYAIETHVQDYDPETLRTAILRELNRDGQVFVVHNRVKSIDKIAERVREQVPEADVSIAHGRMGEKDLASTMEAFMEGMVDVLVCTTIIENGLDIPNANTMIIDRADMLGLAEMHQLRGRIGRYIRKAYAYLFTPPDRPVSPDAQDRLEAIKRYSRLGAGFDIALRDLEIRGAGNILGPEQSGHIAAVGYKLYCRLLERAVRRAKGEEVRKPPAVTVNVGMDAYLPDDYVPAPGQKVELYRELNRACELDDVQAAEHHMRDRFGEPPEPAKNLLLEAEIRLLADRAGISAVRLRDGRIFFDLSDREAFEENALSDGRNLKLLDEDEAFWPREFDEDGRSVAAEVRGLLAKKPGGG
jgi:transcription-repair coupling factor (superfamily II helicase)